MTLQTSNHIILMRIENRPAEVAGQYVKWFNHEGRDGIGEGEFTFDPREAKQFSSMQEAMEFWRRTSITHPVRADGKPNRPLTASTVSLVRFADVT